MINATAGPNEIPKRPNHEALWFASVRWKDSQISMINVLMSTIWAKPKVMPKQNRKPTAAMAQRNRGSFPLTNK